MKYAKKFRVVPYTTETPALSQVATTFNTALTTNTYPDEKVKIYNQALSRIKEIKAENVPTTEVENKNYEINEEDEDVDENTRNIRIAKEIAELEKKNAQNISSMTLTDYSNLKPVRKYKRKKAPQFDNEKFIKLLDELIENSNLTRDKIEAIQNLIPPTSYNNISKNLFSTPASWTMSLNSQLNPPSTIAEHNKNYITNLSDADSPRYGKKRRTSVGYLPTLYDIEENSIEEQTSNQKSFYVPNNNLDLNKQKEVKLPAGIDLEKNLVYEKRNSNKAKAQLDAIVKNKIASPNILQSKLNSTDTSYMIIDSPQSTNNTTPKIRPTQSYHTPATTSKKPAQSIITPTATTKKPTQSNPTTNRTTRNNRTNFR